MATYFISVPYRSSMYLLCFRMYICRFAQGSANDVAGGRRSLLRLRLSFCQEKATFLPGKGYVSARKRFKFLPASASGQLLFFGLRKQIHVFTSVIY